MLDGLDFIEDRNLFAIFYIVVSFVFGIWFSILDIKNRKVPNNFMFAFLILIIIPLPFNIRNLQFTGLLSLAIVIGVFYVFFLIGTIGGADFKYLTISLFGMFISLVVPRSLPWFYISLFSVIYLAIRLNICQENTKTPRKQLFQYLDLDTKTPKFIKLALYTPIILTHDNYIVKLEKNDLIMDRIEVKDDSNPIEVEKIHNFLDINSDNEEFERKIKNGKVEHIGILKMPNKSVLVGDNELLFLQPMIPLIPTLFLLNCIIILFVLMI